MFKRQKRRWMDGWMDRIFDERYELYAYLWNRSSFQAKTNRIPDRDKFPFQIQFFWLATLSELFSNNSIKENHLIDILEGHVLEYPMLTRCLRTPLKSD